METWKELIKAVLSRKFAIAFVGILALCYIANIQAIQFSADEDQAVSIVPDPNETEEQASNAGAAGWLIPTYILFIAVWTVGVQGVLDYVKQQNIAKKNASEEVKNQ